MNTEIYTPGKIISAVMMKRTKIITEHVLSKL